MGLYDELRKELGDGYSLDFRNAMRLLCHVIDEQQAKIERLEKESMICCGDGTVEEWRCGADREIEEYESPPAEPRHEDNPMVANIGETSRFSPYHPCNITALHDPTIRAALDALKPGERVEVSVGFRNRSLMIPVKAVTLIEVGGRPVAACSRCNTPNEYQDGPFTCHSCRNP